MIKGIESILVGSPSATKLAKFYRETVGLKQTMEMEMGEKGEMVYGFETKGAMFVVLDHSKVKTKSKQPDRIIVNFEVDDIKKEVARMKKAKVKVKSEIYHVEGYGLIATFADVDGNLFQFVQIKSN